MVWVPYREDSNVVWYQQVTSRSWYPADLPGQNWRKVAGIMQDMREHTVEEDVITYSSDACWRFRYSFNAFNRDCFESPLCNLSGFFGDITFQFGWRQNLDQWSIQLWFNDDLCLAVGSATQRRKRFSQCIALIAKMQIGCSRGNCVRSDLLLPNHLGLSLAQLSIEKKTILAGHRSNVFDSILQYLPSSLSVYHCLSMISGHECLQQESALDSGTASFSKPGCFSAARWINQSSMRDACKWRIDMYRQYRWQMMWIFLWYDFLIFRRIYRTFTWFGLIQKVQRWPQRKMIRAKSCNTSQ